MLTSRVIPCLDVRSNRVVKGVQFQRLRDVGSPAELAHAYESQGADEIVILDVSATDERRNTQLQTVEEVREVLSIPLTVGGGVRDLDDVQRLTDAGADKVSVNTAAVEDPSLVAKISGRFGSQCTVVAIDARACESGWQVVTHAGKRPTGIDVLEWARQVQEQGAGEVLLTSFDRDGTRSGYDCQLLIAVADVVSIPVIASGGADTAEHLEQGLKAGASAVLIASILHDGVKTVAELKQELSNLGVHVRT